MKVMRALRKELNMDDHDTTSMAFTILLSHVAGLDVEELHHFERDIKHIL